MFTAAIALAIQLLPQILRDAGTISPASEKLIQDLGSSTASMVISLAKGGTVPDVMIVTMGGIKAYLGELQDAGKLSGNGIQWAATLTESIDNSLIAYEESTKVDDPSTLQSLPTDL